MVRAILTCSDDGCTALYEAYGPLAQIERLACDCGCGLDVVGWPDEQQPPAGGYDLDLIPLAA